MIGMGILGDVSKSPPRISLCCMQRKKEWVYGFLRILMICGLVHEFFVPVSNSSKVAKLHPEARNHMSGGSVDDGIGSEQQHYRVWGMTARVLVDAARIAYDSEPQFPHNAEPGDEQMITELRVAGRLGSIQRKMDLNKGSAKAVKSKPGSKLS